MGGDAHLEICAVNNIAIARQIRDRTAGRPSLAQWLRPISIPITLSLVIFAGTPCALRATAVWLNCAICRRIASGVTWNTQSPRARSLASEQRTIRVDISEYFCPLG